MSPPAPASESTPKKWEFPYDPLGAFCRENHVALNSSARDSLTGLAFAVKDVFHIKDARTGFGQPDWLATHEPATETARSVQKLLDAGATLRGKTQTDELAYSLTGENVHYGTPINPRDPARIPGGSSNGSVSAVAGGLVDFALGTDCGGSVRIPASYCGVLGIRPSYGRVSIQGVIPFAPSFDVVGWFARDLEILRRVGETLIGQDVETSVPPQRLVIFKETLDMVDQDVREALLPMVEVLTDIIGTRRDRTIKPDSLRGWFETFRVIQAAEVWANHGDWIKAVRPKFGPGINDRIEWAEGVTHTQLIEHQSKREVIVDRLSQLLAPGDVLCLPTSPRIAPLKNTPTDKIEIEYRHQAMCLLCIAGLGGLPQISLPLAKLNSMPLGISLIGTYGYDRPLLDLASLLYQTMDESTYPKR